VASKIKKRGFVMTGGGAKGLYEAGVIHAFHITGMEFDVITGSSIGAMNSIFFAEYLYNKHQLPEQVRSDPSQSIESMDAYVKAYHHAWLLMPDKRVIDDSETGPIGRLEKDLLRFNITLPQLTGLLWWWTDPDRKALPPPSIIPSVLRVLKELSERLGGLGEVLQIFKHHKNQFLRESLRTYLALFSLDRSLIPEGEDNKLSDIFTNPISPLRSDHLDGAVSAPDPAGTPMFGLINPERTLRNYTEAGVDVRLTRANYRTGRLEVSAYIPVKAFVRFLEKQAWRIDAHGPEKIPLGSFRLQVPGNPVAINAALCSGRFPGVFRPYPIEKIYPAKDPENSLLHKILAGWLQDPNVEDEIKPVYQELFPGSTNGNNRWNHWQESESMRSFFPMSGDTYLDGGAIDNTPSNSAVDYIRNWVDENECSKRDVSLDLYVVFLGKEPKVAPDQAKDPAIFDVVTRTLSIQGAAKESSDANNVETINTFGRRAESLGRALDLVLESYGETLASLPEDQRRQIEAKLHERAQASSQRGYLGRSPQGIVDRMGHWTRDAIARDLPIQVDEVKIYPEEMPLDTLQFTERFGYRKENAIAMLTMGCYNTLWALRTRLEVQKQEDLDDQDRKSLDLARSWMGTEEWPTDGDVLEQYRQNWHCQRTACSFHARHCPHGAIQKT